MNRKIYYLIVISIVAFILTGCSNSADETIPDSGESTSQEMPVSLQLMLGTVLLEETDYSVDADQAAELLPYWQVLQSLSGSERAAQAEVDAVFSSIEEAMTSEQMSAIEEMGLTGADTARVMEKLGIEMDFGSRFGDMDPEMQATMEAMRESGEGPPEGFSPGQRPGGGIGPGGGLGPGGGQGFSGNTGITQEMRETAMAERGGSFGRGFGINNQLLEAVISFLETKTQ